MKPILVHYIDMNRKFLIVFLIINEDAKKIAVYDLLDLVVNINHITERNK